MDVRCLILELKPRVEHAVTCKADGTLPRLREYDGLSERFDAIVTVPKPVAAVIQNCGPEFFLVCSMALMPPANAQCFVAWMLPLIVRHGGLLDEQLAIPDAEGCVTSTLLRLCSALFRG